MADAWPDIERPDAAVIELVRREREQIHAQFIDIHRDFAGGLRGVGVQERPCAVRQARDLRDRLKHTNLVVRRHHAHEQRRSPQGAFQLCQVDQAVRSNRQPRDVTALPFECRARVEDGAVFVAIVTMRGVRWGR